MTNTATIRTILTTSASPGRDTAADLFAPRRCTQLESITDAHGRDSQPTPWRYSIPTARFGSRG